MLDVVEKPLLQDGSLLFREHLLLRGAVIGLIVVVVQLGLLIVLFLELGETLVLEFSRPRELVVYYAERGLLFLSLKNVNGL